MAGFQHTPPYPGPREDKEKAVYEITGIMIKFQMEREKAMLLPTDPVPEEWNRTKEAEAIYDYMIHRGD